MALDDRNGRDGVTREVETQKPQRGESDDYSCGFGYNTHVECWTLLAKKPLVIILPENGSIPAVQIPVKPRIEHWAGTML